MPSVDTHESDFPWESISTVKTHIEAGDGSCGGSIMEPMGIKVKTSHRREESPVPEKFMREKSSRSRTKTWPRRIRSKSMDDMERNASV